MATTSALDVVSEYAEALAAGDAEKMNSLRSEDFVLDSVYGDAFLNRPAHSQETHLFWQAWFAGFDEFDFEFTRTIAGDAVAVMQWVFTGTHTHRLEPPAFDPPLEPTSRTIRIRGVSIYDVADSLIQRETMYMDLATVMVELGINVEHG